MATQEEQNFIIKTRNEFAMSAENAIREIHDKFANFHSQLDQGELDLIYTLEKTQADILQKFDEITPKLNEMQQCRDSVVSILGKDTNKQLLEAQLHSFNTAIDKVIGQSEIDKLIELKWKYCELPINDVCTIATINPKDSDKHSPQANISQTLFPQYGCVSPSYAPDRVNEYLTYDPSYLPPALPPAPTTEWACPHCTLVNPPGIRVCNACSRAPVSNPQTADVTPTGFTKCTHCMAQTLSTSRICQNCGRGLF